MENSVNSKEFEQITWSQALSPLEHKLFGSTPPNMSIVEVKDLIDRASAGEDREAVEKLLKPPILSDENRELVEKAREEKKKIGPYYTFGKEAYDEDFILKDYDTFLSLSKLNKQGLAEGLDIEFVPHDKNKSAILSDEEIFLSLEMAAKKRERGSDTINQLLVNGRIKASFSTDSAVEDGRTKTVMHLRYNFEGIKL